MKRALAIILPVVFLAAGVAGAWVLLTVREPAPTVVPERPVPAVHTIPVELRDVRLTVQGFGTVLPRAETELVAEIAGRILTVSPSLEAGGFFEEGEVLVRIDPRTYEVALRRAEAAVTRVRSERDLARATLARRRRLAAEGVASPAALDEAERAAEVAEATLAEARSAVDQAQLDFERTEIRAPYSGRVREKRVDVGQFVSPGTPVARVHGIDAVEVRVPVPNDELGFLDLTPLLRASRSGEADGPEVVLRGRFAGEEHHWLGRLVRAEGELDPRSRTMYVVARVADPYGRTGKGDDRGLPLPVGLFVEAEVEGRVVRDVAVLPRSVLRPPDRVWIVDERDRLRFRQVEVLRTQDDEVVIASGLSPGERVTPSRIENAVDGMRVRVVDERPHLETERRQAGGSS